MDHPDYLEDEFYPEDYFAWPAGHSDYPDLTENKDYEEKNIGDEEEDEEDDLYDAREIDVVDPINHPIHWIPDRPSASEY